MEEENATMDKEADMSVDQELSLVYRKILHFIPSLLLPTVAWTGGSPVENLI